MPLFWVVDKVEWINYVWVRGSENEKKKLMTNFEFFYWFAWFNWISDRWAHYGKKLLAFKFSYFAILKDHKLFKATLSLFLTSRNEQWIFIFPCKCVCERTINFFAHLLFSILWMETMLAVESELFAKLSTRDGFVIFRSFFSVPWALVKMCLKLIINPRKIKKIHESLTNALFILSKWAR